MNLWSCDILMNREDHSTLILMGPFLQYNEMTRNDKQRVRCNVTTISNEVIKVNAKENTMETKEYGNKVRNNTPLPIKIAYYIMHTYSEQEYTM